MVDDILFGVCVTLLIWYLTRPRTTKKYNLPSGPTPFYFLGNTNIFLKIKCIDDVFRISRQLLNEFNGIVYTNVITFGGVAMMAKPEYMEAVLSSKDHLNKPGVVYDNAATIKNGMITMSGEEWRRDRRLVSPIFSHKRLMGFVTVFAKSADIVCKAFKPLADGRPIQCERVFSENLFGSSIKTMTNLDDNPLPEKFIKDFVVYVEEEIDFISHFVVNPYTYFWKKFEKRYHIKKTQELLTYLTKTVVDAVKEVRSKKPQAEGDEEEETFLDKVSTLEPKYFIGEMTTFLVAGYETTSTTLSHAAACLGMHPRVQDKAYEELKEVFGDSDRPVEVEDLPRLKYLEACINESMRLYPTSPGISRQISTDLKLGKYTIPKDTIVVLMFYVLHRDPELWEKPEEYYPEHFNSDKCEKRHPYAFLPFSAGQRRCIGYKYAMLAMKVTLATLLRRYRIESDMTMNDMKITRFLSLDARHIRIKLKPREEAVAM